MTETTTIVTCIEAGPLEAQVLMLAESLRAFGGTWAGTGLVAVKPRRGPSISAHTRRELRRLDVEFIDERLNVQLDWWNNANKSAVMARLEQRVSTPNITWMDGDMIVLQPLDDLVPSPNTQFIARAGEGYLGSDGDDGNADYWRAVCSLVGIHFSDFGMIRSFPELRPIRAYWQSGIYTYETSTRLGRAHLEIISTLLSSNVGSKAAGIYHQDQVAFALACQKRGLSHSEYRPAMNFNLNPRLAKSYQESVAMRDVKILHHHNSLYRPNLEWAMQYLEQLPSDRLELIRKYVPLSANASFKARLHKKYLQIFRQRRVERYRSRAKLF